MVLPLFTIYTIRGSGNGFNIMLEFKDGYITSDSVAIFGSPGNIIGSKLERSGINLNFYSKEEFKIFEKFVQTFNKGFDANIAFKEFTDASNLKDLKQRNAAIKDLNKKYFSNFIGKSVGGIIY